VGGWQRVGIARNRRIFGGNPLFYVLSISEN